MNAIETRDLRRTYKTERGGEVVALDALTLDIAEGEIFGLLGPNGAGKTTLVKILSTVLLPTAGTAHLMGIDVRETAKVRPLIGIVLGGDRGLYDLMSARQNLEYWSALYRVPDSVSRRRVPELLERMGLAGRADELVRGYSRGMRQRLHLARGLVAEARILFLDEPTNGLDPLASRDFLRLLGELRSEGRTVLLTTHDMKEAESACDRVALIDRGRLIAMETPRSLGTLLSMYERVDFAGAPEDLRARIGALPGVVGVREVAGGLRADLSDHGAVQTVLATLIAAGVTDVRVTRPALEEVYVHLIGDRGLRV